MNDSSHPSPSGNPLPTPPPRLSRQQRRANLWKKIRNRAIGALAVVTGLVAADHQMDVSGRVNRALWSRPDFLRETIAQYWDTDFIQHQTEANSRYYAAKSISDPAQNDTLTHSLTNLDIVVRLYAEGEISENDVLGHVLGSHEQIVTEPGAFLISKISKNGTEVREIKWDSLSYGDSVLVWFIKDVFDDPNNANKKEYNLQIEAKTQWGWYFFTFKVNGDKYTIESGLRLK